MSTLPETVEHLDDIMKVMDSAFDPAFGEAWSRRQVADALMFGHCRAYVLAADGSEPDDRRPAAGFYLARSVLDEEELLLLAVIPEARRTGIGTRLLEHLTRTAGEHGIKRLFLEMRADNPAIALYRQAGFSEIGRRANYYRGSDGIRRDAITFAKSLDEESE